MAARILFYVQHLLGIGHLRRAAIVASALAEAGLEVHFVSGGERAAIDIGQARLRQLPPAKAADKDFSAILDQNQRPIDDSWMADRCALLLSLYREIRPDVVLTEMFPFGRRQFRFELIPLLEATLADPLRPIVVSSVRDILVEKNRPERAAQTIATLRRYYKAVLVHADPSVVRLERTFAQAREIEDMIRYTGFVVEQPGGGASLQDRAMGDVLVSAGGGAVGVKLLKNAILAKPLCKYRDRTWRVITGANMDPESATQLRAIAASQPGVIVETFREDFRELLRRCAVSISQAGYNTLLEIVAAGAPAVTAPFATETESEQTLRAELFALQGLVGVIAENDLDPARLAAAIDRCKAPDAVAVDLSGAESSARIVLDLLRQRDPAP